MILAKIQSKVLSKARKELPILNIYLSIFKTEKDCFMTEVIGKDTQLKAVIEDYCFNEKESKGLWNIAKRIKGTKEIDLKPIKIIEI